MVLGISDGLGSSFFKLWAAARRFLSKLDSWKSMLLSAPFLALAPGLFAITPEKILRLSAMIGDVIIFMLLLIRKRYVVDKVRGVARAALDFGS